MTQPLDLKRYPPFGETDIYPLPDSQCFILQDENNSICIARKSFHHQLDTMDNHLADHDLHHNNFILH